MAIGFELYCKLLEQTIAEMQGREVAEEVTTKVEVDADYLVPESYVPDPEEKMQRLQAHCGDDHGRGNRRRCAARSSIAMVHRRRRRWRSCKWRRYACAPGAPVSSACGCARGEPTLTLATGRTLTRGDIEVLVRSSANKLGFDAADGFKIHLHLKPGDRLAQVEAVVEHFAATAVV